MNSPSDPVYRVVEERLAWRTAGDEVVILDLASSVYFGLDRSGTLIWRHLLDGATAGGLAAALAASAPVERDRAARDVRDFLDALLRHRLIRQG